jgi:PST family polysaccharide transporter
MSLLRKNIFYLLLWQIASYGLPLLTFPYMTRMLGPDSFGLLGFAQGLTAYGVLLADWGFGLSASQEVARHQNDHAHLSRLFWEVMLAKLLLAGASLLLLLLGIALFPSLRAMSGVLLLSWLTVLGTVFTVNWLLQGLERMGRFVMAGLAGRLASIPLVFLLVHRPDDVGIAAAIQSFAALVAGAASLVVARRLGVIHWVRPSLAGALAQLRNGYSVFVASAAINVYTTSNTVILGAVSGVREVGFFNGADRLRTAAQGLINPISQAVYPRANALMAESQTAGLAFLRRVLLLQGGCSLAISLGLFVLAPLIVRIMLGGAYSDTVLVLRWLAALPFLIGISNVFGMQVMLALGMQRMFSRILLLSGVINVALVLVLAHFYGAVGVAMTMVLVELFVTITMGVYIHWQGVPLFRRPPAVTESI